MTEYKAFAAHFEQHFAPEIFKAYLKQVELYIGAQAWLSRRCVKLTIDFLDEWFVLCLVLSSLKLTSAQHQAEINLGPAQKPPEPDHRALPLSLPLPRR